MISELKKYYVVCKKELPTIEKEDLLVGHVELFSGMVERLYPKIKSIKMLEIIHGNDYVKSICLHEIEMETFENNFSVKNTESYYFTLSHHDKRSREYYDEITKKELNFLYADHNVYFQRYASMRFKNDVRGKLYKNLLKAKEVLKFELKLRNEIEQDARKRKFEEYKKLKQEFEPC